MIKKPDEFTDTSAGVEKPDDPADTGRYQRLRLKEVPK